MAIAVNDIGTHFVKTFESNAIHLVQQKSSKFRSKVTEKSPGATEKHSFRTVEARGAMVARVGAPGETGSKRTATVYVDTQFNDRVVSTLEYATADSWSKPDMRRMLEDPNSEIYRAMVPQVGRQYDDLIVAAFHAAAYDALGTANAFGAVGTNPTLGGAGTAFAFGLIADCLEAFNSDDVDPDEQKFLAVPPAAITAILNEPKATSSDYVSAKALMSGQAVDGYMGFSWIMSNRLNHPIAGESYCQAWTRDAMGLLILKDIEFQSSVEGTLSFDTIVRLSIDAGAVRIQEKKCKRIRIVG